MSSQYDDFNHFKVEAERQIQEFISRVNQISALCDQYNIRIVGVPAVAEQETSQQTAELCMSLFAALRVEEVSFKDIDTAHRVPSRVASNRPNAIICKFVRRIARERKSWQPGGLNAEG